MKRVYVNKALCLLLSIMITLSAVPLFALNAAADEPTVSYLEAGSWEDLEEYFSLVDGAYCYNHGHVVIKLTADLTDDSVRHPGDATYMRRFRVGVGAKVTLDFNGHTISCNDTASWANTDANLQDFLLFDLVGGAELTFDDSVGGGGVYMYSKRAIDSCIAALRVVSYFIHDVPYTDSSVFFNGGTYTLDAECIRFGLGTNDENNCWKCYRGTVIADCVNVEVNGGRYEAISRGLVSGGTDWCARELTAFGTTISSVNDIYVPYKYALDNGIEDPRVQCHTVINGGYFISDGYAVHNFDNNYFNLYYDLPHRLDSYYYVNYPEIRGGRFEGGIDYTGLTFTYSDGNEELNVRPADQIVKGDMIAGVKKNGDKFDNVGGLTWRDLHGLRSLTVISSDSLEFSSEPGIPGNASYLDRNSKQKDTFRVLYTKPDWFSDAGINTQPSIAYKLLNIDDEYTRKARRSLEISYSSYAGTYLSVQCELNIYVGMGGDIFLLADPYTVRIVNGYSIDSTIRHCSVVSLSGEMCVTEGEDFNFRITPDDGYEIVDPSLFEVYSGEERLYPSSSGVYTVKNVRNNILLTSRGNEPRGIASVVVIPGAGSGSAKTYAMHTGDTFTLKTPESYGFTAPSGAGFKYWKVGNSSKQYNPGDTFEITKPGTVEVKPVYNKIFYITVIGGKAYADAEHTQPITCAVYNPNVDTLIYVVADPQEEGDTRVFDSWEIVEGRHGGWEWQGYGKTETYFYLSDSDVTVMPKYSYQINEVTVLNFPAPEIGKTFDKYTGVETVPDGAGYSFAYWDSCKDVTGGGSVTLTTGESVFEEGHIYEAAFVIRNRTGNIFPEDLDITLTLGGADPADYTVTDVQFTNSYHEYVRFTVLFEPLTVKTLTTVSGRITSYGDADRPGSVTLTRQGEDEPVYMTVFYGNDTTYLIEDVAAGVYTLTASKNGCNVHTAEITVSGSPVTHDISLEKATLYGDVNDDGRINGQDLIRLRKYLNGAADIVIGPGADTTGDGRINGQDLIRLRKHLNGESVVLGPKS